MVICARAKSFMMYMKFFEMYVKDVWKTILKVFEDFGFKHNN